MHNNILQDSRATRNKNKLYPEEMTVKILEIKWACGILWARKYNLNIFQSFRGYCLCSCLLHCHTVMAINCVLCYCY